MEAPDFVHVIYEQGGNYVAISGVFFGGGFSRG
jgi:hypothetical protein